MYRIELTPGEVTVFRTIEELATGVRNGLITSKARIYHSASDKWLPIEFHPHYKQALDLNAGKAGDAGTSKHGAAAKSSPPKQGSPKSVDSKPSKSGFTFLNVPLSPVTPTPKPKSKPQPRVTDLPFIDDETVAAQQSVARHPPAQPSEHQPTAPGQSPSHDRLPAHDPLPSHDTLSPEDRPPTHPPTLTRAPDAAADRQAIEHSPAYDSAVGSASAGYLSVPEDQRVQQPAVRQATASDLTVEAPHPSVDHSPAQTLPGDDSAEFEADQHESAGLETAAQPLTVERQPAHEAARAHGQPYKPVLVYETPVYRSPAERSASEQAAVHAAFEAHLPLEPIRIEEPVRDGPGSRLPVEELFAPPAPRAALPPVSASPVLELPRITYPEITPVDPPVAERASSGSRARRTLHLAGALVLLAAGGYASTTVFSFGRPDGGFNAASTMADRPVVPVRAASPSSAAEPTAARHQPAPATPTAAPSRAESPRTSSLRTQSAPAAGALSGSPSATDAPLPPASSGFAPALEPRAIVTAPPKPAPSSDALPDSSTIVPPIDMQVTAPDLQAAESLAGPPRQNGDSAMKRILKAVSGRKGAP
jgi:hypothetical protein